MLVAHTNPKKKKILTCSACNLSSSPDNRSSKASCRVDISDTISYTELCV